jgi:DNA primase small subunit
LLQPEVVAIVKKLLKGYYSKTDVSPSRIERREFGFGSFEKKIDFRHVSFRNGIDFKRYLVENTPAFINCSPSEYERPDARPMENKGWLGRELVFDLDATDLKLKCQSEHGTDWVCQECFDGIKQQALHLVEDFLVPDFGFSLEEIKVNFSGNRGYHIHVNNEEIFRLDGNARKSISDYITGNNIIAGSFFPTLDQRGTKVYGPKPTDFGWGGKFARSFISALNSGAPALQELGIEQSLARKLERNKAEVILGISNGNWGKVTIPKKEEFWNAVIKRMAVRISDPIDAGVTNDIYHMIRLPNTIHGDTGLNGTVLDSVKDLQDFDPMSDAVVFSNGTMKVHVKKCPGFSMKGESFGPYEDKDVELPQYAALYLLLKRVAILKG